ncbi:MAG TPA: helix-turn-helix domain-containing protein [Xanthobacteraceae bacterium]
MLVLRVPTGGKRLGRAPLSDETRAWIQLALDSGMSIRAVAKECGVNQSTVQMVKNPREGAARRNPQRCRRSAGPYAVARR